ncbi:hypothetical protein D6789_04510 [Candidatus Woesearchaeota archaeon]|nr:MAG: hypothetical protein D6789_04510 [Candidatus Woesearchaeota archaeon]
MAFYVGLTGKNCAGKDSVADILAAKGFERLSLSDAIRDELRRRGAEITREALITAGNELRARFGASILADRIKGLLTSDRAVIVSIRNPEEIASLRELRGFVLVGVDAPAPTRYARAVARHREGGEQSYEDFLAKEQRENTRDPCAQQLDACLAQADYLITNTGSLAELQAAVERFLDKYEGRAQGGEDENP